ncbi:MAG: hypothetical protein AAFU80_25145 [Pseudomonadota bacterium]
MKHTSIATMFLGKLTLLLALSMPAAGHEVRPAVADVELFPVRMEVELRLTIEPILAGIDLATLTDTNDSPLSGLADRYRAMPPDDLVALWQDRWPDLRDAFEVRVGDAVVGLTLQDIRVPPAGDVELPRDTTLRLVATLPPGNAPVAFGWEASWGPLIVRQVGGDATYSAMLSSGELTAPMERPRLHRPIWPLVLSAVLAALAAAATVAWRQRRKRRRAV